ncbi:DUF4446 family protein [Nocardioides yefusunii]|uniref:DUF4446 family protein n=1 Tax=Nocardioides yefusunii TaxID=2500546 RepID=A0ABW1QZC6_9ACTN|nr:DUF4446 family protein [Nocardioides yefusunii]
MWIVVVFSLLVAVASLAVAALALKRAAEMTPVVIPDAVPEDVIGLRQEVAALRAATTGTLRNVAVVRYDAFGDMGGHLSWSVALLDDSGSGVVMTSIHGRSDSRTYAKTVTDWTSEAQLAPEEEEAIGRARP